MTALYCYIIVIEESAAAECLCPPQLKDSTCKLLHNYIAEGVLGKLADGTAGSPSEYINEYHSLRLRCVVRYFNSFYIF